jgi:hypothetical protein
MSLRGENLNIVLLSDCTGMNDPSSARQPREESAE